MRDFRLLTFNTIFTPFGDIAVHVRPDITLSDGAIRDFAAGMSWVVKHMKYPIVQIIGNIWPNSLACDFAIYGCMIRTPLNSFQFQRVIEVVTDQLELLVAFLQFGELIEIELHG